MKQEELKIKIADKLQGIDFEINDILIGQERCVFSSALCKKIVEELSKSFKFVYR